MKRRDWAFLSGLLALAVFASACSSTPANAPNGGDTATKKAEQVLRVNAYVEPPSIDPALIGDRISGEIATQLFEGLVRLDKDGNVTPGVAKKWEISPDGTKYTFYLQENAKWSNGDPVTAQDFVFSWERALNPKTGAPLANNLYFIKNGEAYNAGKITDPKQLGLKAVNDKTLEVTLEQPVPFFLKLTSFFSMFPVSEKAVKANEKWAGEAATFVSNGPFKIQKWEHNQQIVMVPNEYYWDKSKVRLERIEWKMVNDQNTEYQMFQAGQLDIAKPPNNATGKLLQEGKAKAMPTASLEYIKYNVSASPFKNANIRKALAMAVDRQAIVDKVLQGGQIPAFGLIPEKLDSGAGEFRKLAGPPLFKDNDVAEAKKLFEKGLQELGLSSPPAVTMLFWNNDLQKKEAEALQEMWKKNLGLQVELKGVERKVLSQTLKAGDYQVALFSTGADYDDAFNLMGQFTTNDIYNWGKYSNKEYDKLVDAAGKELDPKKRAQFMVDAEKVLIQDMAIGPLYYRTTVYMDQPYVKNVYRYSISAIDFREAYIEGK